MTTTTATPTTEVLPRGGECECRACGAVFTSPTGFDFHQWWHGPRGEDSALTCLDPGEAGLAPVDRRDRTVWRFPGQDDEGPPPARARNAAIDRTAQILGLPGPRRGNRPAGSHGAKS